MTIKECIDIVYNNKPHQYTIKEQVMWLSFIDGIIINEVLKTHEGYDGRYDNFEGYSEDKLSVVLIVPSPYDRLYTAYLKMMIDRQNGEIARYNNSAAEYNTYMLEFRKHYNKTHMPLDSSSKKHFSPSPNKINPGLTDAEYENLKKDMTYILTEYFNDAVSEDKLNDAIAKYAQNNMEMLKGKDGYTPIKGTDYFTEDEINDIHSKCEEKISNSANAISNKLEEYVNRTCTLKEDKLNKVDAFGDASDKSTNYPTVNAVESEFSRFKTELLTEEVWPITDSKADRSELEGKEDTSNKVDAISTVEKITDKKAYPSAKAVQAYGVALGTDLLSKLPTKLSDLFDDTNVDNPINYARTSDMCTTAIHADVADTDSQGFRFHEYYATKRELGDIETALDSIIAIQNSLIGGDSE